MDSDAKDGLIREWKKIDRGIVRVVVKHEVFGYQPACRVTRATQPIQIAPFV